MLICDNLIYLNYDLSIRKTNDLRDITTVELLYNIILNSIVSEERILIENSL